MAFCPTCGKALGEDARFCSGCGTTVTGAQVTALGAAPAQVTRVVVVEPKKGGRLALKGFLTAFIFSVIFVAATKGDKSSQSVGMVIAFGIGAAYIITNLRKWKKNNDVVQGAGIGWTVAILLILMCLGGLTNVGGGGGTSASSSSDARPTVDAKEVQLREWAEKLPDYIKRDHPEWITDPNKRPSWLWSTMPHGEQGPPWLTDSLEFQHHCKLPHSVSTEPLLPDGRGYRALVLVYPHEHVRVRFSHKTKVNWMDSLRFDTVTFTHITTSSDYRDGEVMEWMDAMGVLGC